VSDIKQCFTSRFEEGLILECDFSQLEVVGLAALSGDPVLIEDLLSGRDMHRFFASQKYGIPEEEVTSSQRKLIKKMTFALQYGSGAKSLEAKNGLKKGEGQDFIDTYYARYSRVKDWQQEVFDEVKRSRVPTAELTRAGYPKGKGEYVSLTGRRYTFFEKDKPAGWRGEDLSPDFNPPEIKNYPIQGFATGDLMALYRARVYRRWTQDHDRDKWLPINTVHDSVMFDCLNLETALATKSVLEHLASNLQDEVEDLWGIVCPVPFKVETKAGPDWASTRKI